MNIYPIIFIGIITWISLLIFNHFRIKKEIKSEINKKWKKLSKKQRKELDKQLTERFEKSLLLHVPIFIGSILGLIIIIKLIIDETREHFKIRGFWGSLFQIVIRPEFLLLSLALFLGILYSLLKIIGRISEIKKNRQP